MNEKKAVEKLECLRAKLPSFINSYTDDVEFGKWKRDVFIAIDNIFLDEESYTHEFNSIRFFGNRVHSDDEKKSHFNHGLAKADALLRSMVEEINDYGLEKTFKVREIAIGRNVFIGHGKSHLWLLLKDFIKEKLGLSYDEFNRVPTAGYAISHRLDEMLSHSCIALLIMTAEDEIADGSKQARMNVVHEVGLFQGRLGFEKAIVLLEEGCEEFSNINGLSQIRFPKGNISAIFQDVREVLEREGLLNK